MFGKGKTQMSSNDKFVMAKGRSAGNLPPVKKAKTGKIALPKASNPVHRGRDVLGSMGKLKRELK